jgi:ubiquinone/menaquinone biosynthesis C-methylase UbiE
MLRYATAHVDAKNVTFLETDGRTIPCPDASITGVFSAHVFQHFDRAEDAATYFREAFRVLAPGGTMMIHAPVHEFPGPQSRFATLLRKLTDMRLALGDLRARYRRRRILAGKRSSLMRGLSYEISWLRKTLVDIGFQDIEFAVFAVRSNGADHPCVFARKQDRHDRASRSKTGRGPSPICLP